MQKITKSQPIKKKKQLKAELPFELVNSQIKLNLSPERFVHSIAFSKMMDRAHRLALRRNDAFSRS